MFVSVDFDYTRTLCYITFFTWLHNLSLLLFLHVFLLSATPCCLWSLRGSLSGVPRSYLLQSLMTIIYNVISPIFTCRFGEGRTQIEGVRSPGVSIWIPKTQVLHQGAEEWCTVSLLPHGATAP